MSSIIITLEEATVHYGELLEKDIIRDIHSEARGIRVEVCDQLGILTGLSAPRIPLSPSATTATTTAAPTAGGGDGGGIQSVAPFTALQTQPATPTAAATTTAAAADKTGTPPPQAAASAHRKLSVTITFDEAMVQYGEVLDKDTVRGIVSEARGNRREVCDQLGMLTGLPAPGGGGGSFSVTEESNRSTGEEGMDSRKHTGMSEVPTGMTSYGTTDDFLIGSGYDDAVATGEDKAKLERDKELNELMKNKVEDISKLFQRDRVFEEMVAKQKTAGPQSLRGKGKVNLKQYGDAHAHKCFQEMIDRERDHCGEFVCFYHSYSYAALLYEVQCCLARVLYGLPDDFGPAARLGKKPFKNRRHMKLLLEDFSKLQGQDHDPQFRAVAISCSVSLESTASEAPPMSVFQAGYSCNDLDFHGVLKKIFTDIGYTDNNNLNAVIDECAKVGERHSLGGNYKSGGNAGQSHSVQNPGHMLQIFVRTDCVDDIAYGSLPYGVYSAPLNPPSQYLTKVESAPNGQARIFWHPSLFLDPTKTKVYHYAGNPGAHGANRLRMQKELEIALAPCLGTPAKVLNAYRGVEGLL